MGILTFNAWIESLRCCDGYFNFQRWVFRWLYVKLKCKELNHALTVLLSLTEGSNPRLVSCEGGGGWREGRAIGNIKVVLNIKVSVF